MPRSKDGAYYAENGKDKNTVAIPPLFAQKSKVQELIDTVEKSLVFKNKVLKILVLFD